MENSSNEISMSILALLNLRGHGKSICPSEVARKLYPENWRDKMDEVRQVACEMSRNGQIKITQGDREIDIDNIKGPIRLRLN